MSILLPLIGFAVFVLSVLVDRRLGRKLVINVGQWIAVLLLAIVAAALAHRFAEAPKQAMLVVGLGIGLATAAAAALCDFLNPNGSALIALGATGAALLVAVADQNLVTASLAAPVGAAIVVMTVPTRSGSVVAVLLSALSAAQVVGFYSGPSAIYWSCGVVIALGAALIGLIGACLQLLSPKIRPFWPYVATLLGVGLAYVCAEKYLSLKGGWLALGVVPLAALLAGWMQPASEERSAFGVVLSSVIWIGIATVAFGLARAFGITLAFVLSTCMLVLLPPDPAKIGDLGIDRALIASGPLMALALHRAFRAVHPNVSQSIDIGQHYALIGLCLGALVPLLPEEWLEKAKGVARWRSSAGSAIWVLVAFAVPALLALFLAPKGLLGFVTGLGLSGFFGALKVGTKPLVLAVAGALASLSVIEYGWLEDLEKMERPDKIHWFLVSAGCLAVAALILAALAKDSPAAVSKVQA